MKFRLRIERSVTVVWEADVEMIECEQLNDGVLYPSAGGYFWQGPDGKLIKSLEGIVAYEEEFGSTVHGVLEFINDEPEDAKTTFTNKVEIL